LEDVDIPSVTPSIQQDPAADKLLKLLAHLDIPCGFERSFRICHESLLTHRFTLTTAKQSFGDEADQKVLTLCHELRMPPDVFETLGLHLSAAKFIHFGFEQGPCQRLYKVYLEFSSQSQSTATAPTAPSLIHLAFKWDVSGVGPSVVARYVWHPLRSHEDILGRMSQIYHGQNVEESYRIARDVVLLAASRGSADQLQYLEVREDGTDRLSFALNLYNVGFKLKDLYTLLLRMGRQFGVAVDQLDALYRPIQDTRAGHVAGGVHRDGEGFFNVYYGGGSWQVSDHVE